MFDKVKRFFIPIRHSPYCKYKFINLQIAIEGRQRWEDIHLLLNISFGWTDY